MIFKGTRVMPWLAFVATAAVLVTATILATGQTVASSPKMLQYGPPQWKGGEYPVFTQRPTNARKTLVGKAVLARFDFDAPEVLSRCGGAHAVRLSHLRAPVPTGETCDGATAVRGVLRAEGTGEDPYFVLPPVAAVKTEALIGSFVLRARIKTDQRGAGFFWAERNAPGFSPDRETGFALRSDGKWHDYYIEIATKSELTRLRFDPGGGVGVCDIAAIEVCRFDYMPVEFVSAEFQNDHVLLRLKNVGDTKRQGRIETISAAGNRFDPFELGPREEKAFAVPLDTMKSLAFEEYGVLVRDAQWPQYPVRGRCARFNPEASCEWITLHGGKVDYQFSPDGRGARVVMNNTIVAALYPLVSLDQTETPIVETNAEGTEAQLAPVAENVPVQALAIKPLTSGDDRSLAFAFSGKDASGKRCDGRVRFGVRDGNLVFQLQSAMPVHGPILRPFGNMTQAVLPGVEYLEEGEYSSSTADIDTKETARFAPSPYWITIPFMAITTADASFTILYDDPEVQPIFATPNFLDGSIREHRMNVYGTKLSGTIRIVPSESLEEAIRWSVATRGLPPVPKRPRSDKEQDALIMAAFNDSILKTPGGWRHATLPGGAKVPFRELYGSDFISTIWEITGKLPETPRIDSGGGHMRNDACFLLTGKGQALVGEMTSRIRGLAAQQRPDGSIGYSGKYTKGHWSDTSSGHCANNVFALMSLWRETGNGQALAAGLKGLDYINKLKTPRGAQVWELSLHTPDIMASARCAMGNTFAYEATGKKEYLDQARRWAMTGLPFVYLRDTTLPGVKEPIMRYAGIAVFGATNWRAPNWMGRPVQWCGLDYTRALIYLAPYDSTLDWKKIAEGMIVSGEIQQYPDGPSIGLLPDSVGVENQTRYPYDINPTTLHYLRRLLEGKATGLNPVFDTKGRHVLSPFKAEIVGDEVVIQGRPGVRYEIIVNGKEVRKIESKGTDRVAL